VRAAAAAHAAVERSAAGCDHARLAPRRPSVVIPANVPRSCGCVSDCVGLASTETGDRVTHETRLTTARGFFNAAPRRVALARLGSRRARRRDAEKTPAERRSHSTPVARHPAARSRRASETSGGSSGVTLVMRAVVLDQFDTLVRSGAVIRVTAGPARRAPRLGTSHGRGLVAEHGCSCSRCAYR
jgi:hypothetical protein